MRSDKFPQFDRRTALTLLAGGVAAATGGCSEMFPYKFRFRTTVEVDTPQGLRSGSGVMEISAAMATFKLPDSHAVDFRFKAETVAIDLPGGVLFMLVSGLPSARPFGALAIDTIAGGHPREQRLVDFVGELGRKESLGRSAAMATEDYPGFVHFRDIRNARTIDFVDPTDLSKTFGLGVKMRRILLTVVDEPITRGTTKRLPDFGPNGFAAWDGNQNGDPEPNTLKMLLGTDDFIQGMRYE